MDDHAISTGQAQLQDAETVGAFIAAWDTRAPRPRTLDDYVRLAEALIGTFIGTPAGG